MTTGLRLTFSDGRAAVHTLAEVNDGLLPFGARVWSRDLRDAPDGIRSLLGWPGLTMEQRERVKTAFLLPHENLLARIVEARATPHVAGGGAASTTVVNHGYTYPQLFVVDPETDYSRFDRFHVNTTDGGTGVDEIMQVLAGGGVRILQRRSDHSTATLQLNCPDAQTGWIITYDGAGSHIGSFSTAVPGTKILMQVIGPPRWTMRYDED